MPDRDREDASDPGRAHAIPTLDGFRAIAITIVMLSHFGLQRVVPGQFGVTLFFFLSGYLITTLLRRERNTRGSISFRAFYLRRVVRILPPMYLAITLAIVLAATGLSRAISYPGLLFDFAFLSNYFPRSGIPIGLWSLAVEEHYYLLFPGLFALLVPRRGAAGAALILLGLCAVVLAVRIFEVWRLEDFSRVNFWTHTRIDSILFGSILALWNNPVIDEQDRLPSSGRAYLLGGVMLGSTFLFRDEVFRQTLRYTVQGLALILIFNAAIRDRRWAWRVLENPVTRFVAALSYMLYLVHSTIYLAVRESLPTLSLVTAGLLTTVLSLAAALLVRRWVELPLGRWRREVERRWRSQAAAPANGGTVS